MAGVGRSRSSMHPRGKAKGYRCDTSSDNRRSMFAELPTGFATLARNPQNQMTLTPHDDDLATPRSCVSLGELVEEGLLDKQRAAEHTESRSKSAKPEGQAAANAGLLSIWELCELVSRSDFKACSIDEVQAKGVDETINARNEVFAHIQPQCSEPAVAAQRKSKHHAGSLSPTPQRSTPRSDPVAEWKPQFQHLNRPPFDSIDTPRDSIVTDLPQSDRSVPWGERSSRPSTLVAGAWSPRASGGLCSARNPQVQLETSCVTLLRLELRVKGACGGALEIWVLRGTRWGYRRPCLARVLAMTQSETDVEGPQLATCECEVPAGDVVTIVLACAGFSEGGKRHGRGGRLDYDDSEGVGGVGDTATEEQVPTASTSDRNAQERKHFHDKYVKPLASAGPGRAASRKLTGDRAKVWAWEGLAFSPKEAPSFDLWIRASSPLARGPCLLLHNGSAREVSAAHKPAVCEKLEGLDRERARLGIGKSVTAEDFGSSPRSPHSGNASTAGSAIASETATSPRLRFGLPELRENQLAIEWSIQDVSVGIMQQARSKFSRESRQVIGLSRA